MDLKEKLLFKAETYLVPALQRPFPLFQHKALMFVWSLDIALSNFQSLNDFPAVWLLEMMTKEEGAF